MNISEVTTLNAPITIAGADGATSTIINMYASIDTSNMSITVGASTLDKAAAANTTNAATIKEQYDQFMSTISAKAASLGFVVFTL